MKKSKLLLTLLLCLTFLSACNSVESISSQSINDNEGSQNTEDTKSKNNKKSNKLFSKKNKDNEILNLNTKYSSENLELTIKNYELTDLIEPSQKDSFYSYYENKNPNTSDYILIHGTFKNLAGEAIYLDQFAYQVVINNKYKYVLQAIYEEGGTLQSSPLVQPLEEKNFMIFGEIPNEALNSMENLILVFGYNTKEDDNMFDSLESKEHLITFNLNE